MSHVVFVVCFCFSGHDTSSMVNCDTYTTTILIELMVVLEVVLVGLESSKWSFWYNYNKTCCSSGSTVLPPVAAKLVVHFVVEVYHYLY